MCAFVVAFAMFASAGLVHPQWPTEPYWSTYDWKMSYPDASLDTMGPMDWAFNGTVTWFNITALNLQQLTIGGTVYNWYGGTDKCFSWTVDYNIMEHWFDNATHVGAPLAGADDGPQTWVGTLSTASSGLGKDSVPYLVETDPETGAPLVYSAIGVLPPAGGQPGSEVLRLVKTTFGPQDPSLFRLPSFC